MAIEHRLGMREGIEHRVCVYRPRKRAVFGRSTNVSSSGMYVRTESNKLPVNTKVQLVTVWREFGVFRLHRVDAVVARQDRSGLGLMFTDSDPREVYRLLLLLRNEGNARNGQPRPVLPPWRRFPPITEGRH
jgi:hypothetical protein